MKLFNKIFLLPFIRQLVLLGMLSTETTIADKEERCSWSKNYMLYSPHIEPCKSQRAALYESIFLFPDKNFVHITWNYNFKDWHSSWCCLAQMKFTFPPCRTAYTTNHFKIHKAVSTNRTSSTSEEFPAYIITSI